MECPTCGGECYDNREKVASGWRGPLWKCKDTACAWTKWPPKGQKGQTQSRGNGAQAGPTGATKRPLGQLYFECLKIAAASVKNVIGDKATPQDIIAATATIFIAASNSGAPLTAPPKPAPPPEPEYDEGNNDGNDFDDPAGLPF